MRRGETRPSDHRRARPRARAPGPRSRSAAPEDSPRSAEREPYLRELMLFAVAAALLALVSFNKPQDYVHLIVLYWPLLCLAVVYTFDLLRGRRRLRIALGASRPRIVRNVVGAGITPVLVGIGVGLIGAWTAANLLESILYDVAPRDPVTFLVVPATIAAVAVVACLGPARRAGRLDPAAMLRDE